MSQQFLYQIIATRPAMLSEGLTPAESAAMSAHFAYLERLLAEGTLILAGRTQNTDADSFGIAIIRVDSEDAARAIMRNDPAVLGGVVTPKLYPYKVALISQANVAGEEET
ncbi:MAG: hypothetical protein H0X24_04210 [Ktedonobacterales bacterium]|nr:hypothetical protein [Ktedonobacterales bacterium]